MNGTMLWFKKYELEGIILNTYSLTDIISFDQELASKKYRGTINTSLSKDWEVYRKVKWSAW